VEVVVTETAAQPGGGIMERLKTATADLHAAAERHPVQTALVRAEASLELYAAWLGQMRHVHATLEAALRAQRAMRPEWAEVIQDDLMQADRLTLDLEELGAASRPPSPAARVFVAEVEGLASRAPAALLGVNYVLEGSKNGNRFIARAMRRRWSPERALGLRYLDPHGEAQPGRWAAYKVAMNALPLNAVELESMVEAARDTFAAVTAISADLHAGR
jgi:heme oxygenase